MVTECREKLSGFRLSEWRAFLSAFHLSPGEDAEYTVLLYEGDTLVACGSRAGCILKYIATAPEYRGQGLTATLVTELRKEAFARGIGHLFLYTKPENRTQFEELRFYAVTETDEVLLMESRRNGIQDFIGSIAPPARADGHVGAVVMNCNPFTLGHRYLIETASKRCDALYVFVLSSENGLFPAGVRKKLAEEGTADLANVKVLPTGNYLISAATFPDYFLKKKTDASAAQCKLDCRIFAEFFAPAFGITERFAGSEPESEVTECYNRVMEELLPRHGIRFTELPRLTDSSGNPISAGTVRKLLRTGGAEERIRSLVPDTTFAYLKEQHCFEQ